MFLGRPNTSGVELTLEAFSLAWASILLYQYIFEGLQPNLWLGNLRWKKWTLLFCNTTRFKSHPLPSSRFITTQRKNFSFWLKQDHTEQIYFAKHMQYGIVHASPGYITAKPMIACISPQIQSKIDTWPSQIEIDTCNLQKLRFGKEVVYGFFISRHVNVVYISVGWRP